jgi:hypothetical protein
MGDDGLRYVWADGGADNGEDASSPHESGALRSSDGKLVEELRAEVHYLREQLTRELERRSAESERYQRIVAGLTQANAALAQRMPELEAPQESSRGPESVVEEPERAEPERAEPRSAAGGAQEGAEHVSWWRRVFGG